MPKYVFPSLLQRSFLHVSQDGAIHDISLEERDGYLPVIGPDIDDGFPVTDAVDDPLKSFG
jgi:hypothetical protein